MADHHPGRKARKATREETGRSARVPLGTSQPKLSAEKRPGFVGRWVNDAGGRIDAAKAAGYQPDDKGRKVQVGTHADGKTLWAFLMWQKEEFYKEDQAAKQVVVDEVDAAMMRGKPSGADGKEEHGYYVPDEGISVKHS